MAKTAKGDWIAPAAVPLTETIRIKPKRAWRDAHPYFRCEARVTLSDGSHAQCGRRYNDSWFRNPCAGSAAMLCTQHAHMVSTGKVVMSFNRGYQLKMRGDY